MYDSLATLLAFGLVLLVGAAAIGHVSGGHVNPAVTLGLVVTGRFPWRYVPAYLIAQLVGAVLGALAAAAWYGYMRMPKFGLYQALEIVQSVTVDR